MDTRTLYVEEDFSKDEQGFNFCIGLGDYADRIREILVPETIFGKIRNKSKELKLPELSKIDYHTGAHFKTSQLKDVLSECKKLEKNFSEKLVLKYIKCIEDLCMEALQRKIDFYIIGL